MSSALDRALLPNAITIMNISRKTPSGTITVTCMEKGTVKREGLTSLHPYVRLVFTPSDIRVLPVELPKGKKFEVLFIVQPR
jgi:hypothetical protein